jgi:hypothetical protein
MSAGEALKAARAAGIRVEIDGDDLVLEAPVPPPPVVLDLLSRHKAHIIAILGRQAQMTVVASSRPQADHSDRNSADPRALAEPGYGSWQTFVDWQRAEIDVALDLLPTSGTPEAAHLLEKTRQFIASDWFGEALQCGWTLHELFGLDSVDPLDEFAAWGLVVGLALAPKEMDEIVSIDKDVAAISYRSTRGWRRRIERRFEPPITAVVWWQCEGIIGSNGA